MTLRLCSISSSRDDDVKMVCKDTCCMIKIMMYETQPETHT
jgi:hypothetical protein